MDKELTDKQKLAELKKAAKDRVKKNKKLLTQKQKKLNASVRKYDKKWDKMTPEQKEKEWLKHLKK